MEDWEEIKTQLPASPVIVPNDLKHDNYLLQKALSTPLAEYHVSGARLYHVNGIFSRISAARPVYRRIAEDDNIYTLFEDRGIWHIAMVDSDLNIREILYDRQEHWTSSSEEEPLMRVVCKPSGSWYEGRNWNPPEWLFGEVDFMDSDGLWNFGYVRHIGTENWKVKIETMHTEEKTEYVNFPDCARSGTRAFSDKNPNLSKDQKVLVLVEDAWRKARVVGKSTDYPDKWEFELLIDGPYGIDGIFLDPRSGKIGIL